MKRLNRIFREDKKTVIVAMDHGMGLPVNPALDNMEKILTAIVRGGADALLTTYGVAKRYADLLQDIALIVRLDGGNSCLGPGCEPELLFRVEDAIKIGADAVACMGFPGSAGEEKSLKNLAKITTSAHEWGFHPADRGGVRPAGSVVILAVLALVALALVAVEDVLDRPAVLPRVVPQPQKALARRGLLVGRRSGGRSLVRRDRPRRRGLDGCGCRPGR